MSEAVRYIGIDPGNRKTAVSILGTNGKHSESFLLPNGEILAYFEQFAQDKEVQDTRIGIEMIASYGMAVGKTVFETCVFIGRLNQILASFDPAIVYRASVKMHLCRSMKAKDANIRQALLDLYPETGGGKCPQIGVKSNPGPLFGVSKDMWASLGVAHTARAHWDEFEKFSGWVEGSKL